MVYLVISRMLRVELWLLDLSDDTLLWILDCIIPTQIDHEHTLVFNFMMYRPVTLLLLFN